MQEISVQDAVDMLDKNPGDTVLLDVREDVELQMAAVEGAIHMRMQEIPQRLDELDKDKTILCMCHSGMRSAQVAAFLEAQGFTTVFNVDGGIDAWAAEVDPAIPRY